MMGQDQVRKRLMWHRDSFDTRLASEDDTACGKARRWLMCGLAALVVLGLTLPAVWPDADEERDRFEQGIAAGSIAPVQLLLARVREDFTGRVLKLELEEEDGQWIYEVKWLTPVGTVLKLYYDASDLALLEVKGRHDEHDD